MACHFLDQIDRVQQIRFAGTRRATAHIHPRHRAVLGEDNGDPGEVLEVGIVAYLNTRNIGNSVQRTRFHEQGLA